MPHTPSDPTNPQHPKGKGLGRGKGMGRGKGLGKGKGGGGHRPAEHEGTAGVRDRIPAGAITIPSQALIYLNVPKSACTTIKNQLYFAEFGRYIDEPLDIHHNQDLWRSRDHSPAMVARFEAKLAQRHLVFTFVRHPGRRAYSCFGEKIFSAGNYSFPKVRDLIVAHYGLRLPAEGAPYSLEEHRRNFGCYLDFLTDNFAGRTTIRTDAHWGRQTQILAHFQRYFLIDYIGRVEQLGSQFAHVIGQLPLRHQPDLSQRFNEGPKPPFSYEEVVDAAMEERLRTLYRDDYLQLGYAAEPARPQEVP